VAIAIAMAVGLFGLRVVMNYAFGRAVGSSASLYVHAAFLPVIFALNQLPVSVGDALGLRETSTVYFYGLAGIPAATSLAMAVLARLAGYAMASPGALLYILGEVGPERDGERDGAAPTAGRRSRRGLGESAAAPRRNAASACASADVATGAAGPAPRARTAP
jgi:hypothetical protein